MIQVTPQMRVLVAVEAVDFRKGIDGLAQVCRQVLRRDPFNGTVFVFRSRSGKAVKLLIFDGQGFWLCQKRLSSGKFRWWPRSSSGVSKALEAQQLAVLLSGGNPAAAQGVPPWRRVNADA
jgi:transposase